MNTVLDPLVNMVHFRPVGDSVLFGRVDLDANNALRFEFVGEVQSGAPVLVFRNGGLFDGLVRDTRTVLVESTATRYRFCAIQGGCDYVDATFELSSATQLSLNVLVKGQPHELWSAKRVEERTVPSLFPARTDLPGDEDFPPMPSGELHVTWASPVAAPTDVWVVLSTTSCIPTGSCQFSRWIKTSAIAGATDATIRIDQLHGGTYSVLGVVDANNDLASTLGPDSGDLITVLSPQITVAPSSSTTTANLRRDVRHGHESTSHPHAAPTKLALVHRLATCRGAAVIGRLRRAELHEREPRQSASIVGAHTPTAMWHAPNTLPSTARR